MRAVVFYVSGHGFGHASRNIEIINALQVQVPDLHVIVRTTAAQWLFELTVNHPIVYRRVETDTGVVQVDSLHLDAGATIGAARDFMRTFDQRVSDEVAFLKRQDPALVVADIPPLGVVAAREAGVASVALGNFTWDWVYRAYDDSQDVVERIGDAYAMADVALRLPLHGGFETCGRIIDLPLIARRSRREPAETRRALGLPADERLALVSFGGYGLDGLDLDALSRLEGYVALVSGSVPIADLPQGLRGGRRGSLLPLDEQTMYTAAVRYEDLVRAVDVVVSKPGFGIVAECVANDTALLYTSRGLFAEYDVFVAEMPRILRVRYIDHADLFAGRWAPHLDALLAQPAPPERPAVNGAEIAADLLLKMI